MAKNKPPIPEKQLVNRLRLMADAGGMLTKDRIEAVRQAADRIEEYSRHIEKLMSNKGDAFPLGKDSINGVPLTGGDSV